MSTQEDSKSLEMRVVELENRLKALQPEITSFSLDEVNTYYKVSRGLIFRPPTKCIFECSPCINECAPGLPCDPVQISTSLLNYARLARVADVLSEKVLTQLTEEVTQNVALKG